MATVFKLPLLGQTMQEGTILKWHKQEGDVIEGWETLVEVETDKVNMEVDPQVSGVVRKILAAEGATVPVGTPIAIIAAADESIEELLAGLELSPAESVESAILADAASLAREMETEERVVLSGNGEPPAVSPRAREAALAAELDWHTLRITGTGFEGMVVERDVQEYLAKLTGDTARITPLAARIAEEEGLSLAGMRGSGPGGKITADDVRRAMAEGRQPLPTTPARPPAGPAVETLRLTGVRKRIADRLGEIYRAAPHVPLRADLDLTELVRLREQLLSDVERRHGLRLTITDFLATALARTLPDAPALNGTLEGDMLTRYREVHLGVAVAREEGLIVPVLRDVHTLSLVELALGLRGLREAALTGRLQPDQVSGGTFTLTNLGAYGVDSFDPILNPPQVAILGAGRIFPRLVPIRDQPVVRQMMTATLVFDHRALDGAPAASFLASLRDLLENPSRLLL
jgi:pyruvate dehydrogenase E2 component (dihydrolipoamide acetyltransferase)